MWTITFRRTFCYLITFIYDLSACIFWMFGGLYLDQDQAMRLFWLVLIFLTSLFVNVYRCNDILPGKNYSRTILEPPKLSPVCIQYDTTDANLELTVDSYILRCCVYPLFSFLYFWPRHCLGCLNVCYAFEPIKWIIGIGFFSHSRCTPLKNTSTKSNHTWIMTHNSQVMVIIIDHFNLHALEMFLYTKIIPVHILCSYWWPIHILYKNSI
jgi:hypothetical protein